MKSLLLKDFINLRSYMKTLAIMTLFYGLLAFSFDEASFLSGILIITFMMIPISSFSYDQHSKWDVYAQSLPITRNDIVFSKYVLSLIALFIGFVVSCVLGVIVELLKGQTIDWLTVFITNAAIVVVGLFFLSVLLPLVYKFGVEKSRIMLLLIFALPTIAILILSKLGITMPPNFNYELLFTIVIIVILISFALSYFISLKIYKAMEF